MRSLAVTTSSLFACSCYAFTTPFSPLSHPSFAGLGSQTSFAGLGSHPSFVASSRRVGPLPSVKAPVELELEEDLEEACLVEFSPGTMCNVEEPEPVVDQSYLTNLGVLLLITWMWALNTPAVRYMYTTLPAGHAPPIIVMNAGAALAALLTVLVYGSFKRLDKSKEAPLPLLEDREALNGGLELGTYKFLGVGFNYLGISLTLSSQAAFFVQLTTIMVPVAQALMGVKLGNRIWTAALLALGGVAMLAVDGAGSIDPTKLHDLILGDAICTIAACWYACYDVRVNAWSKKAKAVNLTTWKTVFQSLYACVSVAVLSLLQFPQSEEIRNWFVWAEPGPDLLLILGVMAFSGAVANGLATLLQIGAQEVVGPSRAQLIYATNPMWNALIAVAFLGEQVGGLGYAGATSFFAALTIAATSPPEAAAPAVAKAKET
ncbi:unnamed protein product [Chrysoparadoxa australica]